MNPLQPLIHPQQDHSVLAPETTIFILVDTAYITSTGGGVVKGGVYMFDNRANLGSSGQGSYELSTRARRGDYIGFYTSTLDPNTDDTVTVEGIEVSSGNVFGSGGYPRPAPPDNAFWVGQAENTSASVYQIRCKLVTAELTPRTLHFMWDPAITVI